MTYGNGTIAKVRNASRHEAQCSPNPLYTKKERKINVSLNSIPIIYLNENKSLLWVPNNGKAPANVDLVKLFAAKALAA